MTLRASLATSALLFCTLALPAWGQQYYLYEPKPVTAEEKEQSKGGVLVTEISVQKGDTLYDISKKFSGRGMYYPQILLFNNIKDPNLIYPGNSLKVPLTKEGLKSDSAPAKASSPKPDRLKGGVKKSASPTAATPAYEISSTDLNKLDEGKQKSRTNKTRATAKESATAKKQDKKENAAVAAKGGASPGRPADASPGQKLFESAVKTYRQNDYRSALELFDRYLADNPGSPLAADASLYKAECYLKLSSQ